ncbi:hypothetical protein [Kitasatospora kifunensis]|uniref:Uncharacterized protein n=1 Tax=Kitasatospora kifunensis TaxID=58351 RepID=A0A7W7R6Q5_KITKI|nr:hypothetical protein [Kitasatospora kifunensis]MBB4926391.1 hypothetical protein [Kitasatospora kifunensis]
MNSLRQQVTNSIAELNEAINDADADLDPLDDGWIVTDSGAVLIRLRPLGLLEIARLAQAIRGAKRL